MWPFTASTRKQFQIVSNALINLTRDIRSIAKGQQQIMDATERLNTAINNLRTTIEAETAQFAAVIADMRNNAGVATEAQINAWADAIEGSTNRVAAIVPDAPAEVPPAPATEGGGEAPSAGSGN